MNEREFQELSAGHALGALSPEDERSYVQALSTHPAWVPIADEDAETTAVLGDQLPSVTPPAALRAQLLSAIAQTPQDLPGVQRSFEAESPISTNSAWPPAASVPETRARPELPEELAGVETDQDDREERSSSRWTLKRGMFALVASVALLSMIAVGTSTFFQIRSVPSDVVALQQIEAAPDANSASANFTGGAATVHWSEELGKTVLVADGLPQLDSAREFELWFVRGETPIPAGTFTSENGVGVAQFDEKMQPGDVIAVTIEDVGGSPTGLPTTDAVVAIETA